MYEYEKVGDVAQLKTLGLIPSTSLLFQSQI